MIYPQKAFMLCKPFLVSSWISSRTKTIGSVLCIYDDARHRPFHAFHFFQKKKSPNHGLARSNTFDFLLQEFLPASIRPCPYLFVHSNTRTQPLPPVRVCRMIVTVIFPSFSSSHLSVRRSVTLRNGFLHLDTVVAWSCYVNWWVFHVTLEYLMI